MITVGCRLVAHRQERIRMIRLKLVVHTRLAEYNQNLKGMAHSDTAHEWGVVEELSSQLSRELRRLGDELEECLDEQMGVLDTEVMENSYDL